MAMMKPMFSIIGLILVGKWFWVKTKPTKAPSMAIASHHQRRIRIGGAASATPGSWGSVAGDQSGKGTTGKSGSSDSDTLAAFDLGGVG